MAWRIGSGIVHTLGRLPTMALCNSFNCFKSKGWLGCAWPRDSKSLRASVFTGLMFSKSPCASKLAHAKQMSNVMIRFMGWFRWLAGLSHPHPLEREKDLRASVLAVLDHTGKRAFLFRLRCFRLSHAHGFHTRGIRPVMVMAAPASTAMIPANNKAKRVFMAEV
jgi:hypothetical protein